jgi:hypothetical protein
MDLKDRLTIKMAIDEVEAWLERLDAPAEDQATRREELDEIYTLVLTSVTRTSGALQRAGWITSKPALIDFTASIYSIEIELRQFLGRRRDELEPLLRASE